MSLASFHTKAHEAHPTEIMLQVQSSHWNLVALQRPPCKCEHHVTVIAVALIIMMQHSEDSR